MDHIINKGDIMPKDKEHSGKTSEKSDISPEKAKKMLKEGTAHGKPITKKQQGMLGAIVSGSSRLQ